MLIYLIYAAIGFVALAIGVISTIVIQKSIAKSKAKAIIEEATREAEAIKKDKLFEAREAEIQIKAEA